MGTINTEHLGGSTVQLTDGDIPQSVKDRAKSAAQLGSDVNQLVRGIEAAEAEADQARQEHDQAVLDGDRGARDAALDRVGAARKHRMQLAQEIPAIEARLVQLGGSRDAVLREARAELVEAVENVQAAEKIVRLKEGVISKIQAMLTEVNRIQAEVKNARVKYLNPKSDAGR